MPSTRAVLFNMMYNFKGEAPVSESVDTDEQKILVVNSKPSTAALRALAILQASIAPCDTRYTTKKTL
jgi:hypothetical protein